MLINQLHFRNLKWQHACFVAVIMRRDNFIFDVHVKTVYGAGNGHNRGLYLPKIYMLCLNIIFLDSRHDYSKWSMSMATTFTISHCLTKIITKLNLESPYQWIVTGLATLLVTLMTTVSPSLAYRVGPGNILFTIAMLVVLQALVTFWVSTCTIDLSRARQRLVKGNKLVEI